MSNYLESNAQPQQSEHTYQLIDCHGKCGNCIALVVDGVVVAGPPFHLRCQCVLKPTMIDNAPIHRSNLCTPIAPNTNCNQQDVLWLKSALYRLGFYIPDKRADENRNNLNPYPNQNLFDAINGFQTAHKTSEHGTVKPGYWTEVKINEEFRRAENMDKVLTKDFKNEVLKFEGFKQHFYLDSKGILTIGIGQNVSDFNDFEKLNIMDKRTGNTLTINQKHELYSKIMQEVSENTFKEKNHSNLEISKNDIYNQFNTMLEKSYKELEQKMAKFNDFPTPVKQALIDMQFNMGNKKFSTKNWPKLFEAINNHDWQTAAKEARQRIDVQKTRQDWTYKMFMDAK